MLFSYATSDVWKRSKWDINGNFVKKNFGPKGCHELKDLTHGRKFDGLRRDGDETSKLRYGTGPRRRVIG